MPHLWPESTLDLGMRWGAWVEECVLIGKDPKMLLYGHCFNSF